MKRLMLFLCAAAIGSAQIPITINSIQNQTITSAVIAQKFFGTSAPGSVTGNLPGDTFNDTTNHKIYTCNAPAGTSAPACTAVTAGGWTETDGSGGGGSGTSAVLTNVNSGTFTATPSYSVSTSTIQVFLMPTLTGNVTGQTMTTTSATSGQILQWIYTQDGTGGRTVAQPSQILGACDINAAINSQTIMTATWDGTHAQVTGCVSLPSGFYFSGSEVAALATPGSGKANCWADSTDHSGLECKANASGSIFKLVLSGVDVNTLTGQVNGLKGVPFCTGFTPTNGQALEYTTGSSPNPCYTATAPVSTGALRRTCDIPVGDASGTAITDAQLGPQPRICLIPAAATILELDVNADGGTPNVIVGRNHAGTVTNIVASALATAASGGIACSNTGGTTGINGATTCSATLQNTSLAAGDYLELVSGTAGGTAKLLAVHVVYSVN